MIALSLRKQVRAIVEEARLIGPRQQWHVPNKPVVPESRKGRFCYSSAEFRQDPKELWADEITQHFAEGVLEATDQGFLAIAFLRARTAADWESRHCEPGIYLQLFKLVAKLTEEHGRGKVRTKMTEAERLKAAQEKLHEITKEMLDLRKHKHARSLLGVIEQISAELTPRRVQLPLEIPKGEQ
jgi:hypothetical protein